MSIDFNADMGEGIGNDAELFRIVTSASIACGGHAGDNNTMRAALRMARENGVRVGAHPGFADPEHFGRRRLSLPTSEIVAQIGAQVAALTALAAEDGIAVDYLKLHGALANMAAEDFALATAIFQSIAADHPGMAILALENSAQQSAAQALGLTVLAEAYADRTYLPNGLLAPREMNGAVIHDTATVVARCLRLAEVGEIVAIDGSVLSVAARSICLHGDTPGAVELALAVRLGLENAGLLSRKTGTH